MKIGWLADDYRTVIGGAELCVRQLIDTQPRRVEIVPCRPGAVVKGCDLYVIHNCTQYRIGEVAMAVRDKPFVKVIYEQWFHGDPALREWILKNANVLFFLSKPHLEQFPHDYAAPTYLIPTIVDLTAFREAWAWGRVHGRQRGVMWMAQMTGLHKGVEDAVRWAVNNDTPVDFFGGGPLKHRPHNFVRTKAEAELVRDMGQVPYRQVPMTMQMYQRFLFLPTMLDTCSRTIFEANASGLDLVTNDLVGARWWLEERPEDVERGSQMFWDRTVAVADEAPRSVILDAPG